jgi:hypothetical protein
MTFKKFLSLILVCFMLMSVLSLTACGGNDDNNDDEDIVVPNTGTFTSEGGSAELVFSLASSIAIITVTGAFVAKRTLSSKG